MKSKLVPLSKSIKNRLGIVDTKQGMMYRQGKLVDKKRYQSADKPPENKVVRQRPEVKTKVKADKLDESKGLY